MDERNGNAGADHFLPFLFWRWEKPLLFCRVGVKMLKEMCMEGTKRKYDREIILSGFLDERILRKGSGVQGV